MYSYFTFLELVKVISVHRAHRLLSEATLILCYVEEQAFGDRQWFRPASERQRYQHTGQTTLASSHKRPLSRLPVHLLLLNGSGFCREITRTKEGVASSANEKSKTPLTMTADTVLGPRVIRRSEEAATTTRTASRRSDHPALCSASHS